MEEIDTGWEEMKEAWGRIRELLEKRYFTENKDEIVNQEGIPSIKVSGLSKVFGELTAIDNTSFEVYDNEVFGLLGPNGSGKTTTLRILSTVLPPTAGTAEVGGYDIIHEPERVRYNIGYVPQKDALYTNLTAFENLDIFSTPFNLDKETKYECINKTLKKLGLFERRDDLVGEFSGGMTKRLSIACALIHNPNILFLDEITVGLDPSSRYKIWDLVKELKKSNTVIFTTHYMDEAEKLCDRVAIMNNGRLLYIDSPKRIMDKFGVSSLDDVMKILVRGSK